MQKTRVAILRGGPSSEYDVSLKTGAAVLRNLDTEKYTPLDIFIDKKGVWHRSGMPRDPSVILPNVDVVFNALHGSYGEDGAVQKILDRFNTPYTGSTSSVSALCMNKLLAKRALEPHLKHFPLKLAKHTTLSSGPDLESRLERTFDSFPHPMVVKPLTGGSSVGVTIVENYDGFLAAVTEALNYSPKVLLEEYIPGREATCGVVEGFRGEEYYSLLPIEIIPPSECRFFDYKAKYSGESKEICPGNFSFEEKELLQRLASEIHQVLGLRHYSRSDFIISPQGIYFLEVNTLPGLTEESLVPKALTAVGSTFPQFLDHLLLLALTERY